MAATVVFAYNGTNELVATCAGLLPSTDYTLVPDDPDSTFAQATSDGSGNLTLTVSDIGGLSDGDTIMAYVGDADTNPLVGGDIFLYGTASAGGAGIATSWAYDGAHTVSATFTGVGGHSYFIEDQQSEQSATGQSPLSLDCTEGITDTVMMVFLDDFGTGFRQAVRFFTPGTANDGFNGGPQEPGAAYATTSDLFRVLRVNTPTPAQVVAAQGDLDTATLEINSEIDLAVGHSLSNVALELCKGVCIDRAADLWRHRESAAGILGIVDEGVQTTPGRYSFARYTARLSVLKDQWGVA